MKKQLLIESIGMQGAGKTKFARLLSDRGAVRILPARFPWILYALRFASTHLAFCAHWIAVSLMQSRNLSAAIHKLYMFAVKTARYQYAVTHASTLPYLLDESFLQGLLSLYETEVGEAVFDSWIRRIPRTDAVLYVQRAAYDEAAHISARRNEAGREHAIAWQQTFKKNLLTLQRVLRRQHMRLVDIDSDNPEDAVRCIGELSPL
jgi:hypothetical protein